MAEYEKTVRDILRKNGCRFVRHGKGDHDVWYSPPLMGRFLFTNKSQCVINR